MSQDDNDYNLEVLFELQEEIRNKISKTQLKYLHFNTINNFLFHFNRLMIKQKAFVYRSILQYLTIINDAEDLGDINGSIGKELFDKNLQPIAKVYDEYLGFTPYPSNDVLIFFFLCFLLLFYVLSLPFHSYILLTIIFSAFYIRFAIKKKKKTVYGYFY